MSSPEHQPVAIAKADEVAKYLGMTTAALAQMRYKGTGPKYMNPGGSRLVRYAWTDVNEWLESGTKTRTDDRPVSA